MFFQGFLCIPMKIKKLTSYVPSPHPFQVFLSKVDAEEKSLNHPSHLLYPAKQS